MSASRFHADTAGTQQLRPPPSECRSTHWPSLSPQTSGSVAQRREAGWSGRFLWLIVARVASRRLLARRSSRVGAGQCVRAPACREVHGQGANRPRRAQGVTRLEMTLGPWDVPATVARDQALRCGWTHEDDRQLDCRDGSNVRNAHPSPQSSRHCVDFGAGPPGRRVRRDDRRAGNGGRQPSVPRALVNVFSATSGDRHRSAPQTSPTPARASSSPRGTARRPSPPRAVAHRAHTSRLIVSDSHCRATRYNLPRLYACPHTVRAAAGSDGRVLVGDEAQSLRLVESAGEWRTLGPCLSHSAHASASCDSEWHWRRHVPLSSGWRGSLGRMTLSFTPRRFSRLTGDDG